jgi:hypothetical protein
LIGAANDRNMRICTVDVFTQGNKVSIGRALFRDEEDYDAMRRSYEGKNILGPRGKGGEKRDDTNCF